jgi:hypothetical protein
VWRCVRQSLRRPIARLSHHHSYSERTAGFGCLGATGKTIVDESAESAPKRGSMSWIGQHAPASTHAHKRVDRAKQDKQQHTSARSNRRAKERRCFRAVKRRSAAPVAKFVKRLLWNGQGDRYRCGRRKLLLRRNFRDLHRCAASAGLRRSGRRKDLHLVGFGPVVKHHDLCLDRAGRDRN